MKNDLNGEKGLALLGFFLFHLFPEPFSEISNLSYLLKFSYEPNRKIVICIGFCIHFENDKRIKNIFILLFLKD